MKYSKDTTGQNSMSDQNSPSLSGAHHGYEFQDAAVAYIFLDALYHGADEVVVDRKEFEGDLFDDVTVRIGGKKYRKQFKCSVAADTPLQEEHFKTKQSDLRLDDLVASFSLASPSQADEYRLCATWRSPEEGDVLNIIEHSSAAGSFGSWPTRRWKLKAEAIWPEGGELIWKLRNPLPIARIAFLEFCGRFVIELECPSISTGPDSPGHMELLIADYLTERIGVGRYPNNDRNLVDVTNRLIRKATQARARQQGIAPIKLLAELNIRTDFGKVAQRFPVISAQEVKREDILASLLAQVEPTRLLSLVGPPGSGKSWLLTELADSLRENGVLVAIHYCYLQPGDTDRERRITTNVMYANLMADLAESVPELHEKLTTRYAAGPRELGEMLSALRQIEETRIVVLIIDGLDHIARIAKEAVSQPHEEFGIIEELVGFPWPDNVRLVIGSQPGSHLQALLNGNSLLTMPPWSEEDVARLSESLGVTNELDRLQLDQEYQSRLMNLVQAQSEGNPLYASFLLRAVLSSLSDGETVDPAEVVRRSPKLEGDISNYYRYLIQDNSLDPVVGVLAFLEFAVTESQLGEMFPVLRATIADKIKRIGPVLLKVTAQGGLRVYHESFRRFVIENALAHGGQATAMMRPIVEWLEHRGFYNDNLSYRFLLTYLRRLGDTNALLAKVHLEFLTLSLCNGHPEEAVRTNLAVAAQVASGAKDWPKIATIAELQASTETCFEQKLYEIDTYGRALSLLKGGEALQNSLLFEGRPTCSYERGLILCSLCADLGLVPPWEEYLSLHGPGSFKEEDRDVAKAHLRARFSTNDNQLVHDDIAHWKASGEYPPSWYSRLYAEAVLTSLGISVLANIVGSIYPSLENQADAPPTPKNYSECIVEFEFALAREHASRGEASLALQHALGALKQRNDMRVAWRCLNAGIAVTKDAIQIPNLGQLTEAISPGRHTNADGVAEWFATVSFLSRCDLSALDSILQGIEGTGWYPAWLDFVVDLSKAETMQKEAAETAVIAALELLSRNTDTCLGQPRACDLYFIRHEVHEGWQRALKLLHTSSGWSSALRHLGQICRTTTTSLQGAKDGPLSPEDFTELLLPYASSHIGSDEVVMTISSLAERTADTGGYFEAEARLLLHAAISLAKVGRTDEAQLRWQRACQCLGGYGFRKDTTIYQLIDSLSSFASVDKALVKTCLVKLQPLIWELDRRTDGRGTKRAIVSWYYILSEVDPQAAAILLARSQSQRGGVSYWRIEECFSALLSSAATNGDAGLVLSLLETRPHERTSSHVDTFIAALRRFYPNDPMAGRQCFLRLVAQVDGSRQEDRSQIRDSILKFALDHDIDVSDAYPAARHESQTANSTPAPSSNDFTPLVINVEQKAIEVMAIFASSRRLPEVSEIVAQLAPWFGRQIITNNISISSTVLTAILPYLPYGRVGDILSSLATSMASCGSDIFLAQVYALAQMNAFDSSWYAGEQLDPSFPLLMKAIQANEMVAWKTVSDEIGRYLQRGSYGVCRARHLIMMCTAFGWTSVAKQVWDRSFEVIQHRLLSPTDLEFSAVQSYSTEIGEGWHDSAALLRLLISRIDHPDLIVKRAALTGLARAISHSMQSLTQALRDSLTRQTPISSLLLILQTWWQYELPPYRISSSLREELTDYANCNATVLAEASRRLVSRLEAQS